MSGSGDELMIRASRQLDQVGDLLGTLDDGDLQKLCPDVGGGGDTVGSAVMHLIDGYYRMGRLLQSLGDSPNRSDSDTDGHMRERQRHGHDGRQSSPFAPKDSSELRDRFMGAKIPIALLGGLREEQLASVPPAVNQFADGRRTLAQVINRVLTHQDSRLATVKRAVAA